MKSEMDKRYWVATYYGTGLSQKRKTFESEIDALEWWNRNVGDTRAGLSTLQRVETIRES